MPPTGLRSFFLALGACLTAGSVAAQETVAVLEVAVPSQQSFILRGTIPVPINTFPRADGLMPFSVRDADGTVVPAQVEAVSHYPVAEHGCDVVEVLARVNAPSDVPPGNLYRYEILDATCTKAPPALTGIVRDVLSTPGMVTMHSKDPFGHSYELDLLHGQGGRKMLKRGREVRQVRHSGVLTPTQPVAGSNGTLPHLMGVHSYVTAFENEDVIAFDLRIHNAVVDADPGTPLDDPMADLYFDRIELRLPAGWLMLSDVSDPMLGGPGFNNGYTEVPLVLPNADGSMHFLPQQAQFQRRFVITTFDNISRARIILQERGLGFAQAGINSNNVRYFSWWNPDTARYFAQRQRLPDLDHIGQGSVRVELENKYSEYRHYLETGDTTPIYPLPHSTLGWARPWGNPYGGMTSGVEIHLYDGMDVAYGASNEGYRFHQLKHRMYSDRMADALFHLDGEPTTLSHWLIQGPNFPYVYMLFYQKILFGNDPFGFSFAPTFQADYVQQAGLRPSYQAELDGFEPIDLQHLGRYLNSAKILAWLGNDALAKDDILMQAEVGRLSYHSYPTESSGNTIVSGMLAARQLVDTHPHNGFSFGRGQAWIMDAMACAYSMGSSAWRNESREWFAQIVDLAHDGQILCSGMIQAEHNYHWLGGSHRARNSVEQAMVDNALWGVLESVHMGTDPEREVKLALTISRSAYGMIQYPAWDSIGKGPWAILAVAPLNYDEPAYCDYLPGHGTDWGLDKFQIWNSFAYGYQITGDPIFLQRALEAAGGSDLNSMMEAWGLQNLENRSALTALSQILNYP